jgi:hypothetical protein
MKKKNFDINIIKNLYYGEKKSMEDISKILNTSRPTILKFLKENNLDTKNGGRTIKIIPTLDEEDILKGCLLGDGHLTKINSNSCFSYGSSINNHTKMVYDSLKKYSHDVTVKNSYDKRTNKKYTSYYFKTILNEYFTDLRKKWYPDGIKIIPNDLILTRTICLYWYIGDGGLIQNYKNETTSELILNTNSFSSQEIDNILLPQMILYNAYKRPKKNGYVIVIPRKSINLFFDFIGECPIDEYKHKWNVFPYKNKNIEKNGINKYENIISEIILKRKNGEIPFKIAKDLKINTSVVKYYLKKNNLFIPYSENNLLKKWKIIDPNGVIYQTNNLTHFCDEHKLPHMCLRDVAHNRMNNYRHWLCEII